MNTNTSTTDIDTIIARLIGFADSMDNHAAAFATDGNEPTAQWARGYAAAMRHAAGYVTET
jgi:hypothetical protein